MVMLNEAAKGVYVIAVTPFSEDGALDLESIDSMIDFHESVGVTGITVLGQLGEAPKLTAAESTLVVQRPGPLRSVPVQPSEQGRVPRRQRPPASVHRGA